MYHLVILVIVLGLYSGISTLFITHIPVSAYIRQAMQEDTLAGVKQLQAGVSRYFHANVDAYGNPIFPGLGVDMAPLLAPTYSFMPAATRGGLVWQVSTGLFSGSNAVAICVFPSATAANPQPDAQKDVLSKVQLRMPVNSAFLGSNCGASLNSIGGDHLTIWLPVSQYVGA